MQLSFWKRYCAAPATKTRLSTLFADAWECHEVARLSRKTTLQPAWKPSKRRGFAASPIDTARPQENQRLETIHVGASNWAFRATSSNFDTVYSFRFKFNLFLRVFLWTPKCATSKSMFRARVPSIFSTSHKMPRLPRNLRIVTMDAALTMRFAKTEPQDTCKVLRLPWKLQRIFWDRCKSICHAKPLSTRDATRLNVTKCHACHAKQSNATPDTSKSDPCCRTYHRHGHITALTRTLVDGCEPLRAIKRTQPQCSRPSIILFLSICPSVYLSLYFSLSRSVQFPVSLCVLLSVHLII